MTAEKGGGSREPDLTLQEAADLLGVHYMTAYRYVRTGRLPGTRVGAHWQVQDLYFDVLGPAMRRVGDDWQPAASTSPTSTARPS